MNYIFYLPFSVNHVVNFRITKNSNNICSREKKKTMIKKNIYINDLHIQRDNHVNKIYLTIIESCRFIQGLTCVATATWLNP